MKSDKRRHIPVLGSGYFGVGLADAEKILKWPGAWVLILLLAAAKLMLTVVTPAGKAMTVLS